MANDSKTLFQSFVRKGLSDRDALFAVIDHFSQLHCFDRDRYDERVRKLEEKAGAGKPAE
jgi:hypothetical protein